MLFFPDLLPDKYFSEFSKHDFLPAPRNVGGLLGNGKVPSEYDNVYTPEITPGSADVKYVTYTREGIQVSNAREQNTSQTISYAERSLYVRNLSIYEGGHIYTGISFVGEAREIMFQDGRFPIIIADSVGRPVAIAYAEATTNWAIPGWVRFRTTISSVLPNRAPCTMIFQSARMYAGSIPVRVAIPILCN